MHMNIDKSLAGSLALFYFYELGPAVFVKEEREIKDMRPFVLEMLGLNPEDAITDEIIDNSHEQLTDLFDGDEVVLVSWMKEDDDRKIVDTFAETSDGELVIYVVENGDFYNLVCKTKEGGLS